MKKSYNLNYEIEHFRRIWFKRLNEEMVIDKHNKEIVEKFIQYFHNDSDFESENLKLSKGIALIGGYGTGKTKMIRTAHAYNQAIKKRRGYKETSANNAASLYQSKGADGINIFKSASNHYDNPAHLFIDDLGTEPFNVIHFGTSMDVLKNILDSRYESFEKGILTHVTTNLDVDSLRDRYGERIYSRFHEMFNIFHLGGPDRRKQAMI